MANKSLGRGLSAFLQTELDMDSSPSSNSGVVKISLGKIQANPYQPRQFFDDEQLQSLAASIKRKGVFQPILVQKLSDGTYQLVAGERRMRASQIAGLDEIPAIITDFSKEEQLEIAILENVQRENLNPIEEAEGYKRLLDEFDHTQEQLSEIIGKSRSHISNVMRLLNLPDDVKQMIKEGKLSFGHARALVTSDDASAVAKKVLDGSLNVRDTEKLVRRRKNPQSDARNSEEKDSASLYELSSYVDPEVLNISRQIEQLSGLKTNIKLKGSSNGIIELSFENFNQLDKFIQKINY